MNYSHKKSKEPNPGKVLPFLLEGNKQRFLYKMH